MWPLKVGITGGIGSGKSFVCRIFEALGAPVFYADSAARHIMEHNAAVVTEIKALFGADAYKADGKLDNVKVAADVFATPELREQLNSIVHPAVGRAFEVFCAEHFVPVVFKEAAIMLEAGSHHGLDYVVTVYAPEELRIARTLQRDKHRTREDVLRIIKAQLPEEEKLRLADFVIENDGVKPLLTPCLDLYALLQSRAAK